MKNIEIAPAIEADPGLLRAIQQGHDLFGAKFGRTLDQLSATWSLIHDDRGQALVRIDLTNSRDDAHVVWSRDIVDDPRRVFTMILWAAGDLWRAESHRLLDEIRRDSPALVETSEGS